MNKTQKPTKERIELEKAKKNLRLLDLKAKLSEAGIDIPKVPRQKLDELLRCIDLQNNVFNDSQAKINAIQEEARQAANSLAIEGEAIVESLRKEYGDSRVTKGELPVAEKTEKEACCGCPECIEEKPGEKTGEQPTET